MTFLLLMQRRWIAIHIFFIIPFASYIKKFRGGCLQMSPWDSCLWPGLGSFRAHIWTCRCVSRKGKAHCLSCEMLKLNFDKVFSAKCNAHFQEFQYLCILLTSSPLSTFIYYFSNSWKHPWLSKDINSRFVNRNPIHNMLNNLASSFHSSMKEEIDVQSRKRQKTDIYPAFLLNFCCPRSSYDLHFEPTKTIVEFKVIHYSSMLLSVLVCT